MIPLLSAILFAKERKMQVSSPLTERTLTTLANGSELVKNVAQAIIGNDVADTMNGSPLTQEVLFNLAQTEFQAAVSSKLGV